MRTSKYTKEFKDSTVQLALNSDEAVSKIATDLDIQNAQKKWTMLIRNWSLTISQPSIYFEGRLDKDLNL